ncbi:MAG: CHASE2 domain-containing sensor protein [Cyclobacteriaceae bacterium]|jgi:CHASE2 domain-containing sensor protein
MRHFLLDTIFCTLFIFGLVGLFASITMFNIFNVVDPVGDMFADFELTDVVMSQLQEPPAPSEDIVLVNISYADRASIGEMIQILGAYKPAVIGVDVTFSERKPYAEDSLFIEALKQVKPVVIGSEIRLPNPKIDRFDTLIVPEQRIVEHADLGFVNLITDAANQDDVKTNREMVTKASVKRLEETQLAFAVKLAQYKNPEAAQRFLARGNTIETINYRGNVMDFGRSTFGSGYYVLDYNDVFTRQFSDDLIEGKVVILCFLGQHLGDLQTRTDLYFTPLNKRYVGKSTPDMFGGVIHANAVSMILDEDYIHTMNNRLSIVIAIFLCLSNVFLFKIVYASLPKWYDGITKITQLFELLILTFIMIWLFESFNYKADLSLALILIALSGDSIEVYQGVIKNIFSRKDRAELLKVKNPFKTT